MKKAALAIVLCQCMVCTCGLAKKCSIFGGTSRYATMLLMHPIGFVKMA